MRKLSFVIPCYRSENTINSVVDEIIKTINLKKSEYDYEIVLVNDNSPDNVWSVIESLCEKNPKIKGVNLASNFGQHSALMAGYAETNGEFVVTIDDDGQTPADDVFKLVDKIDEGFDVVYGEYAERKDSYFRKMSTRMNNFMSEYLIGKPKNVHFTSYFIARKYIIEEIIKYTNPYPYIWGLVVRTTKNIANTAINHRRRDDGTSGYTFAKLLGLWMNGFTAFSVKPLRLATYAGFLFAFFGTCFIIFIVIQKILKPDLVPGYSSIIATLLLVGGMLMVMLGLIGEYIGRIYICINASPQYVIKDKKNSEI